ncbi:MAG TPA: hypothetical protein VGP93_16205, partial [Polyangiaceae bacterium]|nr:hypothetical protein [Polyangiaceae bacterium]
DAPSGTTCPSADCWELTNGTGYTMGSADGFTTTWPKFTPFAQRLTQDMFFISFTTNRAYGYEVEGAPQLWMFAVDTAQLTTGTDPSYPPVWLPYQRFEEQNLEPYWTEELPCKLILDDADAGTTSCTGCAMGEDCITNVEDNTCYCAAIVK